ncbi:MAG: aminomethyl transferase family protein [Candidatus Rokubacteria bacterium]|nr:aminomethyl transferase family protein [Candidatus Rokubacteria bacterium]
MTERSSLPDETAAAEYAAGRRAVGLLDRSDCGLIEVTGRDRAAFLHAMLSNDVKALGPGQGCATGFLDIHGKVQGLLVVWALDDRLLVLTPPSQAEKTVQDLDRYLFSEKAVFRNASGERALFMLAGPGAPALAARVTGVAVPDRPWFQVTATLAGAAVRLVRGSGETGEPEVWVDAPAGDGPRVRQALGEGGARPIGAAAFESLRIEAGTPRFGQDVDDTVLLPELSCEDLVSNTKGCYLGQEVVVRIRDRGHVNRHLRGLVLEGNAVPAPGSPILAGGTEIGRVTSATWSFGLRRPIALGFVKRQYAEPGTTVAVSAGGRLIPATVSALPFPR